MDTIPSQVSFTASHSDDLFAPTTGGPSRFQPYILPLVPDLPHPHQSDQHTPTISNLFPDVHFLHAYIHILPIICLI